MTGRITYFFSPISAALPHVREGKLVALAVSTAKRSSVLKDTPTIAESGVPGFDYVLWVGMFAPAATPPAIVEQINADVSRVLKTPDVQERLTALGAEAMTMSPADFHKFTRDEIVESGRVIKAAGITAQ
jgi:tripartite-type tricarboxylate transporter receptor subunit TctC